MDLFNFSPILIPCYDFSKRKIKDILCYFKNILCCYRVLPEIRAWKISFQFTSCPIFFPFKIFNSKLVVVSFLRGLITTLDLFSN